MTTETKQLSELDRRFIAALTNTAKDLSGQKDLVITQALEHLNGETVSGWSLPGKIKYLSELEDYLVGYDRSKLRGKLRELDEAITLAKSKYGIPQEQYERMGADILSRKTQMSRGGQE
ncbi:hypothetical protein HN832_02135 [archaeon]|jgi:hypothetical protein|nr:hypothetical protein [archaeon]MBT4373153.1 hypothetical protein [archaeon]MBT4531498.1 hypothetical protein [archaeon]MBT7001324.1 hypothetical protein [archaeon]MBT7282190.1 hypothetical protein [archaeon]